jgi:hypothetical protein
LAPLTRTHIVIVSAKAAVAKADEATSMAASAPHVLRMVMTFLPAVRRLPCLVEKSLFPIWVRKAFPSIPSLALPRRQGRRIPARNDGSITEAGSNNSNMFMLAAD